MCEILLNFKFTNRQTRKEMKEKCLKFFKTPGKVIYEHVSIAGFFKSTKMALSSLLYILNKMNLVIQIKQSKNIFTFPKFKCVSVKILFL